MRLRRRLEEEEGEEEEGEEEEEERVRQGHNRAHIYHIEQIDDQMGPAWVIQ